MTPTLYYHPVSTTCRPIMMFAADHGIPLALKLVDLFSGEQAGPAFTTINPNQLVPVLQDGDFRLTESSAILKYLADRHQVPAYPAALQARARVNEAMDWFATGLSRELAYGLAYPQLMPSHRRPDAPAQAAVLAWSRPRVLKLLTVLDEWMIGPHNRFLLGDRITLADYLGMGLLTLGEATKLDYARWPNIQRWLAGMKARPSFASTHEAFFTHLVAPAAEMAFEPL